MDIIEKTRTRDSAEKESAILDSSQYTSESILKYEKIYGRAFVSTGGLESTKEIVKMLGLKAGMSVLDVGSGLGGSAFHMALEYNVNVHGLDLSHNMLSLANERLQEIDVASHVTFEFGDVLESTAESVYDVIYSRDAFLHIAEKERLFKTLLNVLKPGGLLFFTDRRVCRVLPRCRAGLRHGARRQRSPRPRRRRRAPH
jgi:phosphoethanolamine N-methyltransferase